MTEGSRRVGAALAVCTLLTVYGCGGGQGEFTGGTTPTVPGAADTPTPTANPNVPSPTATIPPMAPSSIHFVSADPAAIGVRQSGLAEQALLTFAVTDANGTAVPGVHVVFQLTGIGDETIFPTEAVTDQGGLVHTTLTSGIRATTVRVVAAADSTGSGTLDLSAQTSVSVFGAPPVRSRFSIGAQPLNVAGRVLFGLQSQIQVFVNDRFGNAVPPHTSVSFVSNGASVVNPSTTDETGVAKATLLTEQNIPPTGIVTVLAFARGEEEFLDNNGNGVFDAGIDTPSQQDLPEPFIDFRPLPAFLAPSPPNDVNCPITAGTNNGKSLCNGLFDPLLPFELFVDLEPKNQVLWDIKHADDVWDSNVVVFASIPVTFSGPLATPVVRNLTTGALCSVGKQCFAIPDGGSNTFSVEIHDDLFNPIAPGSTVAINVKGGAVSGGSFTMPDTESFNQIVDNATRFTFAVSDPAVGDFRPQETSIEVKIESPNGNGDFLSTNGVIDAPTEPPLPTAMSTPTPTPDTLVVVPTQVTLAAGSGAPPNDCNGLSQAFTVSGGVPPYAISGPGGCLSTGQLNASGGQFVYTAGNRPGMITIVVTDNRGVTAQAFITIQGPPTPVFTSTVTPTPAPSATATPSPTVVLPAASIQFIGAAPPSIGVRQSGLPEQSVLTFKVTDASTRPVVGVGITFTLSGIGDETIDGVHVLTDKDGLAKTTLGSGIRATTVRVVATVDGMPSLSAQSIPVAVLGAPPVRDRFSLGPEKLNVAGRVHLGIEDPVTAFVNDRFGNAVPPGTAVSFVSNGASVVNPTSTGTNGEAKAILITEENIPPTGIVTVLAFTRGEEEFLDNNGNGVFDAGIDVPSQIDLPEPFIDFRPLPSAVTVVPAPCTLRVPPPSCPVVKQFPAPNDAGCAILAGENFPSPLCNGRFDINRPFELFVDLEPKNGTWDIKPADDTWDNNIVIFDSVPVTFSGHLQTPIVLPQTFAVPNQGCQDFTLQVYDDLFNPIVGGSTIQITSKVGNLFGSPITVPDGQSFNQIVDDLNRFSFSLCDSNPAADLPIPTNIVVTVTSENGTGTFVLASGTVADGAQISSGTPTATVP